MTPLERTDEQLKEVRQALESLGYQFDDFWMKGVGFNRVSVHIGQNRIGIYDFDRHTFVD